MSTKSVTIYTPPSAEPHISAEDDAFIHDALAGGVSGILGALTCVIVDDGAVRLSGGGVSNKGYVMYVPRGQSHDLTVEAGTLSLGRHDLVVAEFSRGGGDTADIHQFRIITGTPSSVPADPAPVTSDLLAAGAVNQLPLFRIVMDGLSLQSVERIAPSVGGTAEYMRCSGASGTVSPEVAVITKVPVTSTGALSSGGCLSVADGGIRCAVDGIVEVNGSVYLTGTSDSSKYYGCYLKKNSTELTPAIRTAVIEGAVSAPPQLVQVNAGDVITLWCRTSQSGVSCLGGSSSTWLSVRYI